MLRSKVKLELIADETARKTSFKKRTPSLMKKMKEIQTLCDIDACVIMKSPYEKSDKLELWPDQEGVKKAVDKYRAMAETDQNKKTYNMEEYTRKRISKAKDLFEKQLKQNRAKYIAKMKSECMGDRGLLTNLNLEDLNGVVASCKVKLTKIDAMIKLRESGVPPRNPPPPGSLEGGNEKEPVTESSEASDDDDEDEASDEEEDEASDEEDDEEEDGSSYEEEASDEEEDEASDKEEDEEEDAEDGEPLAEDHGGLDGGVAVPVAENIPDGGLTVEDYEPVAENPDGGVVVGGGGDVPAGKENLGDLDITSTTEWFDDWFDVLDEHADAPNRAGSGPSSPKAK